MVLEEFRKIDLTWDKATRRIYDVVRVASSDENGRKLVVQVLNDGQVEDLSGTSLHLYWETANEKNKGLDAFEEVDASKGIFQIYFTTEMASNVGILTAHLHLVDDQGTVTSEPFKISVFKGVDNDAVESSDSFTALTEALVTVNKYDIRISGVENSKADKAYMDELHDSTTAQLAHKVGGGKKAEPEDLSATTLGLVTGNGGPINLLSIPQDKSVDGNKMVDARIVAGGINLFNKEAVTTGGFYRNGAWVSSSNYVSSEFMEIEPHIFYKMSQSSETYCFWGEGKENDFIEGGISNRPRSTNFNAKYLTVAVPNSNVDSMVLTKEDEHPDSYVPFEPKYIIGPSWNLENVDTNALENLKGSIVSDSVNLYNKEKVSPGGFYKEGEWVTNFGYNSFKFDEAEPNTVYRLDSVRDIGLWDKSGTYINGGTARVFSTTSNTDYVTIGFVVRDIDTVKLTKDTEWTETDVPFEKGFLLDLNVQTKREKEMFDKLDTRLSEAENTYSNLYSDPVKLDLPDFSGYDQPYHPSVIYIDNGFNGYKYWLSQSPYPIGGLPSRARWEVPVVYKSNDGINWIPVMDPLDDLTEQEITDNYYMSDSEILYREDTSTLEVWYRITRNNNGALSTIIVRRTTTDGENWTEREEMIDNGTRGNSTVRSQSIIWDNVAKEYRMWHSSNRGPSYDSSPDGKSWNNSQRLNLDYSFNDWHLSVNYFNNKYHLLSYSLDNQIAYFTSDNGIDFQFVKIFMDSKDGNPLYSTGLYRADALVDGDGKVRVYFTGETKDHVAIIGLMIGDSIEEMQPVKKIGADMVLLDNGMSLEELAIKVDEIHRHLFDN